MNTIKLAIIGLGGMGSYHSGVLSKMPFIEITGVCDLLEEKAKGIGKKLNVPWYTDYHKVLDNAEAVWVCTEPFNRRDIVLTCAREGKNIFTEKPIANTIKTAREMVEAADKAGVIYMLGYCLRFWNPYVLMKKAFASGELGELVECWMRRYMPADMSNYWYGWQEKSGGVMLDLGSHDIDWLRWIGGDVDTVFGYEKQVRPTMHAYDHGSALMRFAGGGVGSASNSWYSDLNESSIGIVGTRGAIIVERNGDIRKKIGDGEELLLQEQSALDINPKGEIGKKNSEGNIRMVEPAGETIHEHFIRCINESIKPITPGAEGLKTLATITALHESTQSGKAVKVGDYL